MKISFSDLIFQLVLRGIIIATMVHEYGHLVALRLMGLHGKIVAVSLNMVYPLQTLSASQARIFYAGGGLLQAAVFFLLMLRNRDAENRLINMVVAVSGLIYSVFEAFAPRVFWSLGSTLGVIVGMLLVGGIIIWRKAEVTS